MLSQQHLCQERERQTHRHTGRYGNITHRRDAERSVQFDSSITRKLRSKRRIDKLVLGEAHYIQGGEVWRLRESFPPF